MTRLEQVEFENYEKFTDAIKLMVDGKEAIRTFKNKEGEDVKKKIISNHKLYFGNYALRINHADNGKVYVAIEYFGFDDRLAFKKAQEGYKQANEV